MLSFLLETSFTYHKDYLQPFISLMKELIALIQKDPKWLEPRLECYLPKYLRFKEEGAPELADISWW